MQDFECIALRPKQPRRIAQNVRTHSTSSDCNVNAATISIMTALRQRPNNRMLKGDEGNIVRGYFLATTFPLPDRGASGRAIFGGGTAKMGAGSEWQAHAVARMCACGVKKYPKSGLARGPNIGSAAHQVLAELRESRAGLTLLHRSGECPNHATRPRRSAAHPGNHFFTPCSIMPAEVDGRTAPRALKNECGRPKTAPRARHHHRACGRPFNRTEHMFFLRAGLPFPPEQPDTISRRFIIGGKGGCASSKIEHLSLQEHFSQCE